MFNAYVEHQSQALSLVRTSFETNQKLTIRLEELEAELAVWKLGLKEAVKDREVAVRRCREFAEGEGVVFVGLDGEGCIFNRSYITQGRTGGRQAAADLYKFVLDLIKDNNSEEEEPKVVVNVFYNKFSLGKSLQDAGIATQELLGNFVLGFNSGHPLFTMTDIGPPLPSTSSSEPKLISALHLYSSFQSCKLVLAGCAFDSTYTSPLKSLTTSEPKIALLKSYTEVPSSIRDLGMRVEEFSGLFETEKFVFGSGLLVKRGERNARGERGERGERGGERERSERGGRRERERGGRRERERLASTGLIGEKYDAKSKERERERLKDGFEQVVRKHKGGNPVSVVRKLDPKKTLARQNPPPCNSFYLSSNGCLRGDCKYSHEYYLSKRHLDLLKVDARKSPCLEALKGKKCPNPVDCFGGHWCPFGSSCRYGSECRFSAPGMHEEIPVGDSGSEDGEGGAGSEWSEDA